MNSKKYALLGLLLMPTMIFGNIIFGGLVKAQPYALLTALFIAVSLIVTFLILYFLFERNASKAALATLTMNAVSGLIGYAIFAALPKDIILWFYGIVALAAIKLGFSQGSILLSIFTIVIVTLLLCILIFVFNIIIQAIVGLFFFPKSRLKSLIKVLAIVASFLRETTDDEN